MMRRTVYLESYDQYDEILAYEVPESRFRILKRSEFEWLEEVAGFGRFTREEERVAGVFASSEGPIFFLDNEHVTGEYAVTKARVEPLAGGNGWEYHPASFKRHRER